MLSSRLRLVARVTLVAILIVHLRLHALADLAVAAAANAKEASPQAARSCCCSHSPGGETPPSSTANERDESPLHRSDCPCCPKGNGCTECCVFCVYAKAPCGPSSASLHVASASEPTGLVIETASHVPPPPFDEFFQPPRV